jgi:hypothetical protein
MIMGMFSWVCRACGEELIEGELVRLNGNVGTYDGYGRAGDFEFDSSFSNPVAWHEFCFCRAPKAEQRSTKRSQSARHQGFGPCHLEFLSGYDLKVPVTFSARVEVGDGPGVVHPIYEQLPGEAFPSSIPKTRGHTPILYVTDQGVEDDAYFRRLEKDAFDVLSNRSNVSESEWEDHDEKYFFTKSPAHRAKKFKTLSQAVAAAEKIARDCKEYTICILGEQGRLVGQVYRHDRWAVWGSRKGEDYGPTGEYESSMYVWSRKAN